VGAQPLRVGALRDLSGPLALAALLTVSFSAGWPDFSTASVILLIAASSTLASLWLWRRRRGSVWTRPLVVLGIVANLIVAILSVGQLPARGLLVGVLIAVGVQVMAVGIIRESPGVLAMGPPLLGAAFILSVAESVGGSAQWYTAPLGVVLLSEVEILRSLPRYSAPEADRTPIVVLEWVALGVLAAPPLVEMFTTSLFLGVLALAVAVAVFLWGVVTRVRRRVVAAASLAVATLVLLIFAAAAGSAPASAFFWVVAVGIGLSVMLVAGLLEAYRSKKGRTMSRLDQLMAGWE
jgi:peptidoglycan/LPS O-acetylase OafA/YrhL